MVRYKHIDTNPRFLPIDLSRQLLPDTFEHALNRLLDHEMDLSSMDAHFRNDDTGAPAYPPALLLKVILFGYSQGIVSSRAIERACREQVTFIALCGDHAPHFTTIADFVSTLGENISRIFGQVLFICDRQGLIGREMFAIDGVKLPCNASKSKSGTRADFARQVEKLEAAAQAMLIRHQHADKSSVEPGLEAKAARRVASLEREAAQIRQWLSAHPDERRSSKGSVRKSNRTDGDSAKMATSKGVIQGYSGVAAVDGRHQVIVEAQAHGTGSEQELLMPMVQAIRDLVTVDSVITADAGYHSESNLKTLNAMGVNALIANNNMRSRDERFCTQDRHKPQPDPLYNKSEPGDGRRLYQARHFRYEPKHKTCICPAGKKLYRTGINSHINGYAAIKFQGAQRDCLPCSHRDKCLRTPDKPKARQVAIFCGKAIAESHTDRMKRHIDSPQCRSLYGRHLGLVEPVFGNLRHNKKLNRFTLRGRIKVDVQWKLFCLVHNIKKLAHHGYAQ